MNLFQFAYSKKNNKVFFFGGILAISANNNFYFNDFWSFNYVGKHIILSSIY